MHHVKIEIHLPKYVLQVWEHIPMCKCMYPWQTMQIHAWMDAGFHTLSEARKAQWPIPSWMYHLPIPVPPSASPLCPQMPDIKSFPQNPFYVTDGSRYPTGQCGGAIAVGDAVAVEYTLYPIRIPIQLDHSFAAEVYVAWILLHIRYKNAYQDGHWHTRSQTYTNSQSYISSLESQSEQTTVILRDLINDCRILAIQFRPPTHLFSQKKGTYLDDVLDAVDGCAKDAANPGSTVTKRSTSLYIPGSAST